MVNVWKALAGADGAAAAAGSDRVSATGNTSTSLPAVTVTIRSWWPGLLSQGASKRYTPGSAAWATTEPLGVSTSRIASGTGMPVWKRSR